MHRNCLLWTSLSLAALAAGCSSVVDTPAANIAETEGFLQRLNLEPAGDKVVTRSYPITLAIAPPIFDFRRIADSDGELYEQNTGAAFANPLQPENSNTFGTKSIPGAETKPYLTGEQSRVRPDNKELVEKLESGEAEAAEVGLDPGSDEGPTPEPTTPTGPATPEGGTPEGGTPEGGTPEGGESDGSRRMLLGSREAPSRARGYLVGGSRRVLGINTDDFERQLTERLYGAGYSGGYGGADVETPNDLREDEAPASSPSDSGEGVEAAEAPTSGAAGGSEVQDLTALIRKENDVDWGQATTSDQEIASRNGFDFQVESGAFMSRMKDVFDQFGLFEDVKTLSGNLPDFPSRIAAADNRYADMVMTTTVSRYKVAYHGVDVLNYVGSTLTYMALWFPALWIADEEFRVHLDVQVDINDVRSRSLVWSGQFRVVKSGLYSDTRRRWLPLSHYITPAFGFYHGEQVYRNVAQDNLTALAWQDFERQLVEKLHNEFRDDGIHSKDYQERINDSVAPRSEGLIVGISRYGPGQNVLARFHQESLREASGDAQFNLAKLREIYGENAAFGERPYAEKDAARLAELVRNGQEVAIPAAYLTKLYGAQATRAELLTRLHRLTRARQQDRTFVYLNLETVLVDVPEEFSADGLAKYLLPYDCDLNALERELAPLRGRLEESRQQLLASSERDIRELREQLLELDGEALEAGQKRLQQLETRYSESCDQLLEQRAELLAEFRKTCLDFFDANAISFAWLEKQFNRDATRPLEDLVFLQSKNVCMVLDTTFPGQFTELHYAPAFELALGARPLSILDPSGSRRGAETPAEAPTESPVELPPVEAPPSDPPIEVGGPGKTPGESEPGEGEVPGEEPKEEPSETEPGETEPGETPPVDAPPESSPRRMKLGYHEALRRTALAAGSEKPANAPAAAAGLDETDQSGISNTFLKVLIRPGFIIVLSSMSSRRPLEIPDQKMGAFAYHFFRGATTETRVRPTTIITPEGKRLRQTKLSDVLGYVGRKVGRESRALGRPQEYGVFRKNSSDDFILIQYTE